MPQQCDLDRDAVWAADDARFEAMLAGDAAQLERLMSPECVYIHNSGRREGREADLERIRNRLVQYLWIERHDADVRIYGDIAVMIGDVVAQSKTFPDEAIHNRDTNFLAVWVKADDHWRIVAYSSTSRPKAGHVATV